MKREKLFVIGIFALTLGLLAGCKSSVPEANVDYYQRGLQKEMAGDFAGAAADYSSAIKRAPENAHAYCRRGYVETKLNRNDRALTDYNKAIALQPSVGDFYRYRAQLRFSSIKLDQALLDADKAIELNPKDAIAHDVRGGLMEMAAMMQGAMKGHNKAADLTGDEYVVTLQMNIPDEARRTLATADEEFSTAIALAPNSAASYANRGGNRFVLGRLDDAIADYSKALELGAKGEERANAYYFRGMIHVIQEKNDLALADLNEAIELNPQHWSAYSYRAKARKALGDTAGADSDLKQFRWLKKL